MTRKRANFTDQNVKIAFETYPAQIKKHLIKLRALIFKVAKKTKGVGKLEETVKWGQPSYLTSQSKSGTTLRIGKEKNTKADYAIYFNCQTSLVETFKEMFPNKFKYEKNRAILFNEGDKIPVKELSYCISLALTYHLDKK